MAWQRVGIADTAYTEYGLTTNLPMCELGQAAIEGGTDMLYNDSSTRPDRIVSDDGTGWELLAAAIIEQAVKDYKRGFFATKSRKRSIQVIGEQRMKEVERFFLSKFFNTISTIEPNGFIKKLKEKYEAEWKAKKRMGIQPVGRPMKFDPDFGRGNQ